MASFFVVGHTRPAGQMSCAWERDSWCPWLELLITVQVSSRCLWAPSNCSTSPAWRSYMLTFSALVVAKVIKAPPSTIIASWNRGYWELLPLLWFLFTASLCTEDFASVTIPYLDNEINESRAPESSWLGIFVMNYNMYFCNLLWSTTAISLWTREKMCHLTNTVAVEIPGI